MHQDEGTYTTDYQRLLKERAAENLSPHLRRTPCATHNPKPAIHNPQPATHHPIRPRDPLDLYLADCARFHDFLSRRIDAEWSRYPPLLLVGVLSMHARVALRIAGALRMRCEWLGPASLPVDLDRLIAGLAAKLARLAAHIDRRWPDPLTTAGRRLLLLYGANHLRLARLRLHRHAIARLRSERPAGRRSPVGGLPAPGGQVVAGTLCGAFALDQLGQEWDIDL